MTSTTLKSRIKIRPHLLSFGGHNRLGLALQEMVGAVLSRFTMAFFGVWIGHTFNNEMLKKGVFVRPTTICSKLISKVEDYGIKHLGRNLKITRK